MGPLPLTPVLHAAAAAVQAREVQRWPLKAVLFNTQPPLLLGGVLLAPVEAVPQHSCDNLVELGRKEGEKGEGDVGEGGVRKGGLGGGA